MTLEDLMKLVDEYAEQRHKTGDYTYSQNTALKREELEGVLEYILEGSTWWDMFYADTDAGREFVEQQRKEN